MQPNTKRIAFLSDLTDKADLIDGKLLETQIPDVLLPTVIANSVGDLLADSGVKFEEDYDQLSLLDPNKKHLSVAGHALYAQVIGEFLNLPTT